MSEPRPQLQMLWPEPLLTTLPEPQPDPDLEFDKTMAARWQTICGALAWPYAPGEWTTIEGDQAEG